jgi:hypothetical protein
MSLALKYIVLGVTTIGLFSCKPKFNDVPNIENGSVDAARYVAIGGSNDAGFADGALYYEAQQNAFVTILANQLQLIGGGDFAIPFVAENSNGIAPIATSTSSINAKFQLGNKTDCKSVTSLSPLRLNPSQNYSIFQQTVFSNNLPFNNLSVPDVKAIHIPYKGYGNSSSAAYYNPFFERMCSNKNTASVLSDALQKNPTFFTLNIGLQDVLAYALTGASADTITSLSRFNASIDTIITALTKNGAKGAIANIPDLNTLPYFTTIPYNGLTLDENSIVSLNNLYAPLNQNITFTAGANAFIIEDANAPIGFRQMKSDELILLSTPLDSVKCHTFGSLIPLKNRMVLTVAELNQIQTAINSYNQKIQAVAMTNNLAFVDVNALYKSIKAGIVYNGIAINAQFVKGGAFSLDGLQLNPMGQAILANEFLKAINAKYASTLPLVDITKYRGVIFP